MLTTLLRLIFSTRVALVAENLFLRKQLALFQERPGKTGRPHSALGPGIPEAPHDSVPTGVHRHRLPAGHRIGSTPVLGGLHHEYYLHKEAA